MEGLVPLTSLHRRRVGELPLQYVALLNEEVDPAVPRRRYTALGPVNPFLLRGRHDAVVLVLVPS